MRLVITQMGLVAFGGITIILARPFISWFLRVWLRWLEFESGFWGLRGGSVKMRETRWEQRGKTFCIRMSMYSKSNARELALKQDSLQPTFVHRLDFNSSSRTLHGQSARFRRVLGPVNALYIFTSDPFQRLIRMLDHPLNFISIFPALRPRPNSL